MIYMPVWQESSSESSAIRTFHVSVECEELIWHVDFEDRNIEVIKSGGWSLQFDNELPIKLYDGQRIFIPNFCWHRIHKGTSELVIKVTKLN